MRAQTVASHPNIHLERAIRSPHVVHSRLPPGSRSTLLSVLYSSVRVRPARAAGHRSGGEEDMCLPTTPTTSVGLTPTWCSNKHSLVVW